MNKQERTNREIGLESIMESMYNEDCGTVHASVKRKKKKVKEADDPNVKQRTSTLFKKADAKSPPPNDTVKCDKCNGDGCDHCNGTGEHVVKEAASDLRAEVDEYLGTFRVETLRDPKVVEMYVGWPVRATPRGGCMGGLMGFGRNCM